ncbi:uncharacterized protein SOCE26_005110 [Sorangium cellulosum]|uniref:Terpene synthase n=1 Tax=Sorangium cellulosum TaxID=56 RepID=A0A2L0EIK7_SORCE|nr:terpene synthase family protein [Sorangium cellulosum]AUX39129.1 uncharacterized protein SOCE26_005110 [Sorangium cellulosum]
MKAEEAKRLIREQLQAPGTGEFIRGLTATLRAELSVFGSTVSERLPAAASFATLTTPPQLRSKLSRIPSYMSGWVYAMDALLDTCPSIDYADDLSSLLRRRLELPSDVQLTWLDMDLARDPTQDAPGLDYSIMDIVDGIQPLRRSLEEASPDAVGLRTFDRCLIDGVVPAMCTEARWRIEQSAPTDVSEYLRTASVTICVTLCMSALNAMLPGAGERWRVIEPVTAPLSGALRLMNDVATYEKDVLERKPNPVSIMMSNGVPPGRARADLRRMIDEFAREVEHLCQQNIGSRSADDPTSSLSICMLHQLAAADMMYSIGDFVELKQITTAP